METETMSVLWTGMKWSLEFAVGIYVLDFITGLVHMHLDYKEVKDRTLRLHVEKTIPDVTKFEETNPIFYNASPDDQYLWNFHVHHDAPYPSKDSEWELTMQIVRPLAPAYLISVILCYMGYMNPTFSRIWFGALTSGPLMQKTHFGAHARNHGVLTNETWFGAAICWLQDIGFLLNPASHKKHHEEFDCNFCIFNGWANPVVNRIRQFLSYTGIFPAEAPTAMNRKDRASDEAKAAKNNKVDKACDALLSKQATIKKLEKSTPGQ